MLTELALESKRFWGYDDEFMARCRSELVVSEEDIASQLVFVAEDEVSGETLGFYALKRLSEEDAELDKLFVAPEHIRLGVGRALMHDAVRVARHFGWSALRIESDPFSAAFYESQGATLVGTATSTSTGRDLPLFELRT
jgi:GNAT superfamily N-acetyltransferase